MRSQLEVDATLVLHELGHALVGAAVHPEADGMGFIYFRGGDALTKRIGDHRTALEVAAGGVWEQLHTTTTPRRMAQAFLLAPEFAIQGIEELSPWDHKNLLSLKLETEQLHTAIRVVVIMFLLMESNKILSKSATKIAKAMDGRDGILMLDMDGIRASAANFIGVAKNMCSVNSMFQTIEGAESVAAIFTQGKTPDERGVLADLARFVATKPGALDETFGTGELVA